MPQPTGKQHTIRTVADLVEVVTMDNVDSISKSLKHLLIMVASLKAMSEACQKAGAVDPIECDSFDWIDDGLDDATLQVNDAESQEEVFQLQVKRNDTPTD